MSEWVLDAPATPPSCGPRSTHTGRIVRSTGVLVLATALSRVLGLVLTLLIARRFGTLAQSQAFVVAYRLPNVFRDLVAEGAMASAVVPVLSWYRAKENADEFWRLSQALLTQMVLFLIGLGAVGSLAAPQLVPLIAPGFASDPEKLALTIRLTRILFPFITLVGLWAYFMGLLNALHHFAIPALGPAILNIVMIVACVWVVPHTTPGILALAGGVLIGGVIQVLIQIPVAMRLGFRWRWRFAHPGAGEILQLLGPRMVGSAVYQANVLIDTMLASLGRVVGEGAVAAIFFANRLVQLPLALFGTASAQACLPLLAEQAAHHELKAFRSTLLSVIRMVAFVILPSSVGLMVLAHPIVSGLFERGAFDHRATMMTAQALSYYSLGLLAYAINKVLTGAFYALRDTRTPVVLAAEAVGVNVLMCLGLMWPLRIGGLALAAALSNTMNTYRLARRMETRLALPLLQPAAGSLLRMTAASLFMGFGCWVVWTMSGLIARPWLGLPLIVLIGLVLYMLACRILRIEELSTVFRWLGKLPVFQLFVSD